MQITEQQLLQILPNARRTAGVFVSAINRAAARYDITSRVRLCAFLAQAGHESAELTRLVENLNYGAAGLANTWPARFALDPAARPRQPNGLAQRLERQPEAIANCVYADRMGNGPAISGDGWRYRGRGLLQATGRAQYRRIGAALGMPLEDDPDLLAQPDGAALSAGWLWADAGLNALADAGRFDDITQRINGGQNGRAERRLLWDRARAVLS